MIKNTVFKITGMHCSSCALNIDGELEDTKGIIEANTNYIKQEAFVKFDDRLTSITEVINCIKNVGYTAKLL
jgi:Cu+-exporting ATPase